jgi:proliferating cell nuclear antigen
MAPIVKWITTQTSHIKTLIDMLNCLITDCNITFYPESIEKSDPLNNNEIKKVGGLVIKEVNKTQSILIHCKLDADKFDEYSYTYHKDRFTIGINLSNLLKCIKCMSNFDTMTWIIDDDDINKLTMILMNEKEKKKFSMNLMDLDFDPYDIETVDFPYSVSIPSHDFQKYCKDMVSASDKMEIKSTSTNLFLSASGEVGDFHFELNECNGGIVITKDEQINEEIVQGLFELKYLIIFTRCTNLCEKVILFLKNEYPLVIQYSIADLGLLKLVLSPSKPTNLY